MENLRKNNLLGSVLILIGAGLLAGVILMIPLISLGQQSSTLSANGAVQCADSKGPGATEADVQACADRINTALADQCILSAPLPSVENCGQDKKPQCGDDEIPVCQTNAKWQPETPAKTAGTGQTRDCKGLISNAQKVAAVERNIRGSIDNFNKATLKKLVDAKIKIGGEIISKDADFTAIESGILSMTVEIWQLSQPGNSAKSGRLKTLKDALKSITDSRKGLEQTLKKLDAEKNKKALDGYACVVTGKCEIASEWQCLKVLKSEEEKKAPPPPPQGRKVASAGNPVPGKRMSINKPLPLDVVLSLGTLNGDYVSFADLNGSVYDSLTGNYVLSGPNGEVLAQGFSQKIANAVLSAQGYRGAKSGIGLVQPGGLRPSAPETQTRQGVTSSGVPKGTPAPTPETVQTGGFIQTGGQNVQTGY